MNKMRKYIALLIFFILPSCMALDILVKAPSEVKKGEIFTVEIYAKNVSNCGGLQCNIYVSDNLVIEKVINYNIGADLNLTKNNNNSAFIEYAFLNNPKNGDFIVGDVIIKAIKPGKAWIDVKAVGSNSEGYAIKIPLKTLEVNVLNISNTSQNLEKNNTFSFNSTLLAILIIIIVLIGAIAYIVKKR
ncbi:hypothetical protein ACO3TA_07020 [Methanocaldococcus sp. 28A]